MIQEYSKESAQLNVHLGLSTTLAALNCGTNLCKMVLFQQDVRSSFFFGKSLVLLFSSSLGIFDSFIELLSAIFEALSHPQLVKSSKESLSLQNFIKSSLKQVLS